MLFNTKPARPQPQYNNKTIHLYKHQYASSSFILKDSLHKKIFSVKENNFFSEQKP